MVILLAPAEDFGIRPRIFRAKKGPTMLFWLIFWPFLVYRSPLVTFSSNLINVEMNLKKNENLKNKSQKIQKISKNFKNQKIEFLPKISKICFFFQKKLQIYIAFASPPLPHCQHLTATSPPFFSLTEFKNSR